MSIAARFKLDYPDFQLDIDIELPASGVSALFGHSGSGKTTLLRCIAGLERAPVGQLIVNGEVWQNKNTWLPTHKRPLGYMFQEASLFPHLTVLDNLFYGRRRINDAQQVNLEPIIELLGIEQLLERKPDSLSGGERQRVAIARALAVNPRLLLMDEPLASLDLKRKQEILPYLERLHKELKIPVIYVSHSPDEVARLADYIVAIENGRSMASGPLTDMLTRLDSPILSGEDAGAVLEAMISEIDKTWHLARVDFSGGSLWIRDHGLPLGHHLRVRILARDISLARQQPQPSSIQNVLQGQLDAISDDHHPGMALARLRIGEALLIARITRRAVADLKLAAGQTVWVQIKSVAIME